MSMKKFIPAVILLFVTLAGCDFNQRTSDGSVGGDSQQQNTSQNESNNNNNSSSQGQQKRAMTIQDGVILHAWNWSMNNIKNELTNIII